VLPEEALQGGWCALRHGVDFLNQRKNTGSHNQQIPNTPRTGVPEGVRGTTWDENAGTSLGLNFIFTGLHAKSSFQHVPRFIVAVMKVARSD
jgi:hypothetical protein